MSIATEHDVRQLLKRMAEVERKVQALEAVVESLKTKEPEAKGLIGRAKRAVERMEI